VRRYKIKGNVKPKEKSRRDAGATKTGPPKKLRAPLDKERGFIR